MQSKKSIIYRLFRFFLWSGIGIAILLLISYAVITSKPGLNYLKKIAQNQLSDLLDQQVTIRKIRSNLFSYLEIEKVAVFRIEQQQTIPLLSFSSLQTSYRLVDVLAGKINIKAVNIDSLKLNVLRDSLGIFNFPAGENGSEIDEADSRLSLKLTIGQISVNNAMLAYLDQQSSIDVSIQQLWFQSRQTSAQQHELDLQTGSIFFRHQNLEYSGQISELSGVWSPNQLAIHSLRFDAPGLALSGNGSILLGSAMHPINGSFTLSASLDSLNRPLKNRIPEAIYPLYGNINLNVAVGGFIEEPVLEVTLNSPVVKFADHRFSNSHFQGKIRPDIFQIDQFSVEIFNGEISASGYFHQDSERDNELNIKLKNLLLADLWKAYYQEISPVSGLIDGNLHAAGSGFDFQNWEIMSDFSVQEFAHKSVRLPPIQHQLLFKNQTAQFHFRQGASEIFITGKLHPDEIDGAFSGKITDIEPLAELFNINELKGMLYFTGAFSGNFEQPELYANINGDSIRYQNFPVDSLYGSCEFKNNQLVISELLVGGGANPIDTSQTPFHIPGIGGGFDYRATARGEIQNLDASLHINLHSPAYQQYEFDCGALALNLKQNQIQLESFRLAQDSMMLELIGNFSLANLNGSSVLKFYHHPAIDSDSLLTAASLKQFDFEQEAIDHIGAISIEYSIREKGNYLVNAIGTELSLRQLSALSPELLRLNGQMEFATHFSGSPEIPQLSLDFNVLNPGYENFIGDSLRGALKLNSSSIELEYFDLFVGASHAKAQARLNFPEPSRGFEINRSTETSGEVFASLEDFQLLNTMLPDETQIDGAGWLNLEWAGSIGSPGLSGMITIRNGAAKLDPLTPLFSSLEAELSFQDSIVSINKFDMRVQQFPVKLSGSIVAAQWSHYVLNIKGQIDETGLIRSQGTIFSDSLHIDSQIHGVELSLFQSAMVDLEKLQGVINADFLIHGNPQAPDINGHLDIHRFSFQMPELNTRFSQGRVKILFDHDAVKFDSVYSKINDGSVFVTGKLDYNAAGIQHIELACQLENIKINRPEEFSLNLKAANINYRTQENHFFLIGEVILGESRVVYNFKPQMLLNLARSTDRPKAELPLFLKNTRLNIQLRESENIWLDNNLARLRLHSELNIIATFENPNLGGRLSIEEGYVLYLDRKFNITRGVVDFVDPNRINPIIDLEAKAQLKGYQTLGGQPYEITLAITGQLDQSVVTLTSVPALEKADIISLLTLGATRQQLTSTGVGSEEYSTTDILLERAKAFSSQQISSYAEKQLGTYFGLEQLSIEGNLFKFDKSWGPQLLASKKLSDRMEVYYTTNVGHMNEHNVRLEYALTKKFSLEGQTDQQGRSGIGLKYKLKFK